MLSRETPAIRLPGSGLVVLVGASGSGKSSFARGQFLPTQVLSSDGFRAMICDDEAEQSVSPQAFELMYLATRRRLELGRLAVADATNTTAAARARFLAIAGETGAPVSAIVFDVPLTDCLRHNARRRGRSVPSDVVATQVAAVNHSLRTVEQEGFDRVYVLRGASEVRDARVEIVPPPVTPLRVPD